MRPMRSVPPALLPVGVSLFAGTTALADNSSQGQSMLNPAGPQAQHISDLWFIILVPALLVLLLVGGAIIYAAFHFKAKEGDAMPKQIGGNNAFEFTWTLVPALILLGIFIISATQLPFLRHTPSEAADAMHIKVIGSQWIWNFRYAGLKNASPGVLTIPADEVVNLDINSKDVIHSFSVPRLAGRLDAVPGKNNFMWIQAPVGTYYGQCTEFCGKAHASMTITVKAIPRSAFDTWYSQQPKAPGGS
jgi:cytochrome c oxidase subunit II